MARADLRYSDELEAKLKAFADEAFGGNLTKTMIAILEKAEAEWMPKVVRDSYYDQRKKEQ